MTAALVHRPADLQRAVSGLLRGGRSEGYVRGWAAAWGIGGPDATEEGGQEFARGYAAGASALERNAARGGRF